MPVWDSVLAAELLKRSLSERWTLKEFRPLDVFSSPWPTHCVNVTPWTCHVNLVWSILSGTVYLKNSPDHTLCSLLPHANRVQKTCTPAVNEPTNVMNCTIFQPPTATVSLIYIWEANFVFNQSRRESTHRWVGLLNEWQIILWRQTTDVSESCSSLRWNLDGEWWWNLLFQQMKDSEWPGGKYLKWSVTEGEHDLGTWWMNVNIHEWILCHKAAISFLIWLMLCWLLITEVDVLL